MAVMGEKSKVAVECTGYESGKEGYVEEAE
jgi:hypothetical protein